MLFRKFLVKIRAYYTGPQRAKMLLWTSLVAAVSVAGGLVVDATLPFEGLFNVIRTVLLIPTALSIFVLGYATTLFFHYRKLEQDEGWVPFRMRVSPMWRRRISAVIAAIMFVLVYALGFRVGYTLVSSLFVTVAIGLFAFMRTTMEERKREELGIPDVRDTHFEQERRKAVEARQQASLARKTKKKPGSRKTSDAEGDELS